MKLRRLTLNNFRQFYGESTIRFASGRENITVIHGENGAGKTALLNAFKWVLYAETTSGVQLKEQIITKRAIYEACKSRPGSTVEGWVELQFEHDDRRFLIKRSVSAKVGHRPKDAVFTAPEVKLQVCDSDGKWKVQDGVVEKIGRVLPPDLHGYFFFDGERIEQIVKIAPDEQRQIAMASKKLLGIEILDRADKHLRKARQDLERELRDVGDSLTRALIEEKQTLEGEIIKEQGEVEGLESNLRALEGQISVVEERLRKLEGVKGLQEHRDQLNDDLRKRKDALKEHTATIKKIVSSAAHNVLISGPIASFEDLCDELRRRGELPAGIKKQFVSDLLEDGNCICGAKLVEGSSHRKAVKEWLTKAGLVDVEEKAIRIGGSISHLKLESPKFLKLLDSRQAMRQTDREEVARIEYELDDISDQLKSSPKEEISSLEKRRNEIRDDRDLLTRDLGVRLDRIRQKRIRQEEIDADLDKQQANERKQQVAKARIDAAAEARERINEIQERMESDFRERLESRVSKLFQEISPTPYVVRIDEDYSLHLYDSGGENALPTDGSTGERQILSLAFIGSIIDLTREYQTHGKSLPGPDSTQFPIVMDSPFGALSIYRQAAAEHMPILADQVVVLVSPKQWEGDVERSMRSRAGREYVLSYSTPKEGAQEVRAEISGRSYSLISKSPNEYEFTEVLEVSDG